MNGSETQNLIVLWDRENLEDLSWKSLSFNVEPRCIRKSETVTHSRITIAINIENDVRDGRYRNRFEKPPIGQLGRDLRYGAP